MGVVKIYKGWRIQRHTRRYQTLDERAGADTHYTVSPVNRKPNTTYQSPRFRNPGEAMRWLDAREPSSD